MKNRLLGLMALIFLVGQTPSFAKEGMWIPMLLGQLNEKEMQEMGLELTAEDIYSINQSSLKDAIVIFGRGCTGELVSDQGLLFTNHHCGYGEIQKHSSIDHDYLTDGFWAMSKDEELANPGLSVTFLVRMDDVTERVLVGAKDDMSQKQKNDIINKNIEQIKKEEIEGTHYEAVIKPFFHGNKYYLFVNEVYSDVRLVGAPPSNIGKFGGDTDNWVWPRHTGDFSVFRIYADKDNKPAKYSKDNVPYTPKRHLEVSLKGVEKDDFTFVFGYPGSTDEYLPSYALDMITAVENPVKIKLRDYRLKTMASFMEKDPKVRIQYSAKYARIANGWKKWQGENRGIKRLDAVEKKQNFEKEFTQWANSNPDTKASYGNLVNDFEETYSKLSPLNRTTRYLFEGGMGIEILNYSLRFNKLIQLSADKETSDSLLNSEIEKLKRDAVGYFKDYHQPIDKKIMATLLKEYSDNIATESKPQFFNKINGKYKGDFNAFTEDVYSKSIFSSQQEIEAFLSTYKAKKFKKILKDPAYIMANQFVAIYQSQLAKQRDALYFQIDSLQQIYMKAQMEMQSNHTFFPDANFTLRIAYGKVDTYQPRDGVQYNYFTTLDGIMEKENPDIYDYVVEDKLKELYNNKDYGRYADKDGSMHTCFIASNHTTGGNSGSPVLNSKGQLIGLNFDRNWEGTMSDLMYDPDQCRNITLDVRYCLFIIDKFAGASHLIEEMDLVE
ncbi:MAG: S46 family peptidase [Bacteroidales bacterium]|nr:S46 family peptidase [Bacteroidales bacterium]